MTRCPNLARLPKPPLYSHVHFVQHPGSPNDLFLSRIGPGILDPSHPGTKSPATTYPSTSNEYFRLRAFPNALLMTNTKSTGSPSWPKIDFWADRVCRATALRKERLSEQTAVRGVDKSHLAPQSEEFVSPPVLIPHPKGSIPMNLYFSIGKARTHKHANKRRRLRTKFRAAVNLVVTRGGRMEEATPGHKELVFDEEEVRLRGDKWILSEWAYLCIPNPEIFLAPYPLLIHKVRESLQKIWHAGIRFENLWADGEMRKQKGLPPRSINTRAEPHKHSKRPPRLRDGKKLN